MIKMIKIIKKYKEIILYLIFGVLTTAINIIVFDIFNNVFDIDYKISNFIAWLLSVMFAFFTNKTYVFESKGRGKKLISEAISFTTARLFSLAVDMILMIVFIDFVKLNKMISKVIVNVVVVILNYVLSKLFIFRKEGVHAK